MKSTTRFIFLILGLLLLLFLILNSVNSTSSSQKKVTGISFSAVSLSKNDADAICELITIKVSSKYFITWSCVDGRYEKNRIWNKKARLWFFADDGP